MRKTTVFLAMIIIMISFESCVRQHCQVNKDGNKKKKRCGPNARQISKATKIN